MLLPLHSCSESGHITCGKRGGYIPAPAIPLKGHQGDRVGDALLKALQLEPLVPLSEPHLLPNKGDSRSTFSVSPPALGVDSVLLVTEALSWHRVLSL